MVYDLAKYHMINKTARYTCYKEKELIEYFQQEALALQHFHEVNKPHAFDQQCDRPH